VYKNQSYLENTVSRPKTRVTMADVAQRAEVSMMTVSRVINNKPDISEKTRQHVLQIMREIGYRPNRIARSLATDKSFKVGVVMPSLATAFYAEILEGVEQVLWEHNYNLLLCNSGRSQKREQDLLHMLEEDRVDGVIVFSSHLPPATLTALLKRQRAAVGFSSDVDPQVAGIVTIDEMAAMNKAVNHLAASGKRALGHIGGSQNNRAGRERCRGFVTALQQAGLKVNPDWIVACEPVNENISFTHAVALLEQHPCIDGLVCFNDYAAVGALQACRIVGRRVPDDVAIIGYDDILISRVTSPTLTTLRYTQTTHGVGKAAGQLLLERINGRAGGEQIVVIDHELVIRESAP
jgi:LacI family transcriptional regulator